jgi:hypothetical protein
VTSQTVRLDKALKSGLTSRGIRSGRTRRGLVRETDRDETVGQKQRENSTADHGDSFLPETLWTHRGRVHRLATNQRDPNRSEYRFLAGQLQPKATASDMILVFYDVSAAALG